RPDIALEAAVRATEIDPSEPWFWRLRAKILLKQCRYDEAIEPLQRISCLDPGDTDAWHVQGILLCVYGRYREALAWCDTASAHGIAPEEVLHLRAEALLALHQQQAGM